MRKEIADFSLLKKEVLADFAENVTQIPRILVSRLPSLVTNLDRINMIFSFVPLWLNL